MRRLLAFFVVAAVALALPVLAAEKSAANPPKEAAATSSKKPASTVLHATGQVSKWDAVKKTFSLKTGKRGAHEVGFVFTDKTKFEGVPAVGEAVDVQYVKEGLDKFVAEKITLKSAKTPAK